MVAATVMLELGELHACPEMMPEWQSLRVLLRDCESGADLMALKRWASQVEPEDYGGQSRLMIPEAYDSQRH